MNIPRAEEPTLRKLAQLALNVGQLVGSGGELEPWMSIESYMDEENRALLAAGVPDVEALVASVEDYLSQALLLEADSATLVAHE